MHSYKDIAVFFDSNSKLIGVPCGEDQYGTVPLDIFFVIEPSYNDDELETFLITILDACYSKEYSSDEPTAMQKYTGIKSPITCVKGFGIVNVDWVESTGYTLAPMRPDKANRGGYVGIDGVVLTAPLTYEKGEDNAVYA